MRVMQDRSGIGPVRIRISGVMELNTLHQSWRGVAPYASG
jgi:hypothetical protein